MNYSDYEKVFSEARLNKYLVACGGNKSNALTLYRYNIQLCQKFYGLLNVFEVVLRNAIDNHYRCYFEDPLWIELQLQSGGMLCDAPQRNEVLNIIAVLKRRGRYTNDRVVSSVSLGFWIHLFTRQPFRLGGKTLLRIFPNKDIGLGQRAIFNELMNIKSFRNRIAHHEAICFNCNEIVDVNGSRDLYEMIRKYIVFLGYSPNQLFYGIDTAPDQIMTKIEMLRAEI